MQCFKYGARESINSILDLVVNMLHYDKDLEFPWSDSISTLMQAGTMLLSSIRKDSISLEVVFL